MEKQLAGQKAADYVEDGMTIGLGTGSTAAFFVEELGRRMKDRPMKLRYVSTSERTTELARSWGLPVVPLNDVSHIDLTVDGADEVDREFNGIKGGGGALLIEKIVATYSKRNIWIVDSSKLRSELGAFPLPVEVVSTGSALLFKQFEAAGYQPAWRLNGKSKFITDLGHYIIDLHLQRIDNALALANQLDHQVGVVEHGLFMNHPDLVIVGRGETVEVLTNPRR